MAERDSAGDLPPSLRQQIEEIFVLMEATDGRWRLEFEAEDGRLHRWYRRQGPHGTEALDTFVTPRHDT